MTRVPPTRPSQSQTRAPAARRGTGTSPTAVPSARKTLSARLSRSTPLVQRSRRVSQRPSPFGENERLASAVDAVPRLPAPSSPKVRPVILPSVLVWCGPHAGSTQSVVAYAFIQKEISPHFTPMQWIKKVTKIIIELFVVATVFIYLEGALMPYLK